MIASSVSSPRPGEPIAIDLLPRLRPLVAGTDSPLSEYSLANLFLFRRRHEYRYHADPLPHIQGRTYDGVAHAIPLTRVDAAAAGALIDACGCIAPLAEGAESLAERLGLVCEWRDADSDYVYDADRLGRLDGAKAKRSQAQAFAREAEPSCVPLDEQSLPLALEVLEGWFADVGRPADETDLVECREALAALDRLDLEGLVVVSRGSPVSFLISGPAADGSRIVHFAKGRRIWAGAYPWMLARFASQLGGGRINFEQDLGKPGFAQAKRAFAPVARLRKYRLRRG